MEFLRKIFLPIKEVGGHIVILSFFCFILSFFIFIDSGFLGDVPFVFFYLAPGPNLLFIGVTVIICWFIASLLVKFQRIIMPYKEKKFQIIILLILITIITIVFLRALPDIMQEGIDFWL